jgi:cobalt-zinc-cadmium efflux system membrane fusion protein
MSTSMSERWQKLRSVLPSAAALVFLVGLAVWGHLSHWKFSHDSAADHDASVITDRALVTQEGAAPSDALAAADDDGRDVGGAVDIAPTRIRFSSPDAIHKAGIETAEAEEHAITQEIVANGVISYDQTRVAHLSARVPGTVWRIEKQLGQPFKKGDVLAIIEAVDVGKAKGELLQAVVDYQLKRGIAERLRDRQSVVPERDLYELQADSREAFIRMTNAQQTLINLGLPVQLQDAETITDAELSRRLHFLGLPEDLQKTLDPAATTVSLIPLVAPFDGVVIGHEISLGEVVSPSAEQFVVADISRMWILLDVRREDAANVLLGQEVIFTTDGGHIDIPCTISWISTEVDEKTRTVSVRAEVDNPLIPESRLRGQERRRLLANAFGTGRIRVRQVPHATVVPSDAVQWEGKRWIVFVPVDETTFEARPVDLGISRRNVVEVLNGLEPGERVATTGSHLLKSEIVRSRVAARQ